MLKVYEYVVERERKIEREREREREHESMCVSFVAHLLHYYTKRNKFYSSMEI